MLRLLPLDTFCSSLNQHRLAYTKHGYSKVYTDLDGQGQLSLYTRPESQGSLQYQLANGFIPQIQLGLYMMSGKEVTSSVKWALASGYRGFDCAQMYHNEKEAGKAINDFLSSSDNTEELVRGDIWYTSKLASNSTSYDEVRRSIKDSVKVSGLGYVDLFLLHSPYGGKQARLTSWKALEDAIDDGEVRMGGVSNYGSKHASRTTLFE